MVIQLTEEQAQALARLANEKRQSAEELARQGLDRYLRTVSESGTRKRRWFEALASLHLG